MVIEVAPAKKSEEAKADQAYDLPGYAPADVEATAPTNPNMVRVTSCKKYRGHGCCFLSAFLILALIGVTIYLGVELARMKRREKHERPHPFDKDGKFPGGPSRPNSNFDIDFGKISPETWNSIKEGIESCINVKVEGDEIMENGKPVEVDITDDFDVDVDCLSKFVNGKKKEIKKFLKKCKRPHHGNKGPKGEKKD